MVPQHGDFGEVGLSQPHLPLPHHLGHGQVPQEPVHQLLAELVPLGVKEGASEVLVVEGLAEELVLGVRLQGRQARAQEGHGGQEEAYF